MKYNYLKVTFFDTTNLKQFWVFENDKYQF